MRSQFWAELGLATTAALKADEEDEWGEKDLDGFQPTTVTRLWTCFCPRGMCATEGNPSQLLEPILDKR